MLISTIKKKFPNLYIIIIAIAISLWFEGINEIIHSFIKPSLTNGILLSMIAMIIFYADDGNLNELYNLKTEDNNLVNYGAVIKNRSNY